MRVSSGGGELLIDLDDQELIARAQGGDADAYGEIVRRYQDVAFRVAYLQTNDTLEAEDAAQGGSSRLTTRWTASISTARSVRGS